MEEWRVINDYPNYSISSLGQVKNNKTGRIKKLSLSRNYLQVSFSKKSHQKSFNIHRLVGIHFLPNWNNYNEIDHRNRNKLDNRVINLRWCSRSDNVKNKNKKLNTTSNYFGVCFDKNNNKWKSQIKLIGKNQTNLGYYNTEEEAYNAWKKFVLENNLEKFYEDKI